MDQTVRNILKTRVTSRDKGVRLDHMGARKEKEGKNRNLCGSMQICNVCNKISVPFQWIWKYFKLGMGKTRVWTHCMRSPTAT